jgi:hypothetical protein
LPDGTVSSIVLRKLFYVPGLEGSLFSWRAVKSTGKVYLEDEGDMLVKMKGTDEVILSATEASDKMFYVKSPTEQANIAQSKQPYDF